MIGKRNQEIPKTWLYALYDIKKTLKSHNHEKKNDQWYEFKKL